jgi:hypothetical protein
VREAVEDTEASLSRSCTTQFLWSTFGFIRHALKSAHLRQIDVATADASAAGPLRLVRWVEQVDGFSYGDANSGSNNRCTAQKKGYRVYLVYPTGTF